MKNKKLEETSDPSIEIASVESVIKNDSQDKDDSLSFELMHYTDEEDIVKDIELLDEEVLDYIPDLNRFFYFKDETKEEDDRDKESSITIRAPTTYSWPAIIAAITIMINVFLAGAAYYYSQVNFKENIIKDVEELSEKLTKLEENVYSKRETDLMYKNNQIEIKKNSESIDILRGRIER